MSTPSTSPASETPAVSVTNGTVAVPPRSTRGRAFRILGTVVLMVVGVIAVYAFLGRASQSTDDAQIEADVVQIVSRVGAPVHTVLDHPGNRVKKGDVIVELDTMDLQARVRQAEAELAAAKAQASGAEAQARVVQATSKGGLSTARAALAGTTVSVDVAQAQIEAAQAALTRATTDAGKAKGDLQRAMSLQAAGAASQVQLEQARAAADTASAALSQAEAQLRAAQGQKTAASSRVDEAQARVTTSAPVDSQVAAAQAQADLANARAASSQASLDLAKLQLSYATITSPIDGTLSRLTVHEGQLVQPGQLVVAVVPLDTYVVANFKETQVGAMKPGDEAEIVVDSYKNQRLHGRVELISPATGARFALLPPDNASGNFVKVVQRVPVKITLVDVPNGLTLRAGLSADVTVHVK